MSETGAPGGRGGGGEGGGRGREGGGEGGESERARERRHLDVKPRDNIYGNYLELVETTTFIADSLLLNCGEFRGFILSQQELIFN